MRIKSKVNPPKKSSKWTHRIITFTPSQLVSISKSLNLILHFLQNFQNSTSVRSLVYHFTLDPPFKILEIFVQINRSFDNPYISSMTKARIQTRIFSYTRDPDTDRHEMTGTRKPHFYRYLFMQVSLQQPNRCTHVRRSRFTNNDGQCVTRKGYWIFRRHDPRASTGNTPPRRV